MHSSRMRTVRSSGHRGGGKVECLPLVLGMSASDRGGGRGGGCLWSGVYTPWAHLPGQTPRPSQCGQTDITFPQLLLRTVKRCPPLYPAAGSATDICKFSLSEFRQGQLKLAPVQNGYVQGEVDKGSCSERT